MHLSFNELHDDYGPIVRIGPKKVSIADANAITTIYGIGSKFLKVLSRTICFNKATHDSF